MQGIVDRDGEGIKIFFPPSAGALSAEIILLVGETITFDRSTHD